MDRHNHVSDSRKNIGIAFLLNVLFVFIEIIGGLLTNSIAILSDAVHDLGDSLTLGLSWILEKNLKKRGPPNIHMDIKGFLWSALF